MPRQILIPRSWNRRAKSAIIRILALSHHTLTALVARAANERGRSYRGFIRRLRHWPPS